MIILFKTTRVKPVLLALVLITLSVNVFSQKLFDNKLDNCLLKFELEHKDMWIKYEPNDSLLVLDFIKGLDNKQIAKLKGVVQFQVMVDTLDNICCVSYTNKTTISDKKMDIINRINQMPGWKRVEAIASNDNLCALVSILFESDKYTVIRTGYSRNTGKQALSQTVFKRRKMSKLGIYKKRSH